MDPASEAKLNRVFSLLARYPRYQVERLPSAQIPFLDPNSFVRALFRDEWSRADTPLRELGRYLSEANYTCDGLKKVTGEFAVTPTSMQKEGRLLSTQFGELGAWVRSAQEAVSSIGAARSSEVGFTQGTLLRAISMGEVYRDALREAVLDATFEPGSSPSVEAISSSSVLRRYLEKVGARLGPRFGIVVGTATVAVLMIGALKVGGFFHQHENTAAVA